MNVHIYAYDDLPLVKRAIDSVRAVLGDVPIHVLDGRYALFDGETDLTPGLVECCLDRDGVRYHAPLTARLPFGHDSGAPPEHRPGVHAKARWAFDAVLPPDEWTLKLDADEELRRFDANLDVLVPERKYAPQIYRPDDPTGDPHITRLFVPRYWTPWLDDSLLPRALFGRESALATLATAWLEPDYRSVGFIRRGELSSIEIDNRGRERPAGYQERRVAHLEAIGRADRARELARALE